MKIDVAKMSKKHHHRSQENAKQKDQANATSDQHQIADSLLSGIDCKEEDRCEQDKGSNAGHLGAKTSLFKLPREISRGEKRDQVNCEHEGDERGQIKSCSTNHGNASSDQEQMHQTYDDHAKYRSSSKKWGLGVAKSKHLASMPQG